MSGAGELQGALMVDGMRAAMAQMDEIVAA
jgi:hypothetical protein